MAFLLVLVLNCAVAAAGVAAQTAPARSPAAPAAQTRETARADIERLLAAQKLDAAVAAYDAYVAGSKRPDAGLLAAIAAAELRRLATGGFDERVRLGALERLAARKDQWARGQLELAAGGERTLTLASVGADTCLARLGDPKAAIRLGELVQSEQIRDKVPIIEALKTSGSRKQAFALMPLLNDADVVVQAAAAEALGVLGAKEALPRLRELLKERIRLAPMSAAVAIKRLGDPAADGMLASMLASPAADVRLMAAEAFAGTKERAWIDVARPLLRDPNGLTRLRAAQLLAPEDKAASRDVLTRAAQDGNPTVRSEAARILESLPPYDLVLLRRLLTDVTPLARLYAAGAVQAASAAGV